MCIVKNYKNGELSHSHFAQIHCMYIQSDLSNFGGTLKFVKNPNLIIISSNFLCNIRTYICIRKNKCTGKNLSTMPKSCGKPCCPLY